jgi:hypothetical protein
MVDILYPRGAKASLDFHCPLLFCHPHLEFREESRNSRLTGFSHFMMSTLSPDSRAWIETPTIKTAKMWCDCRFLQEAWIEMPSERNRLPKDYIVPCQGMSEPLRALASNVSAFSAN